MFEYVDRFVAVVAVIALLAFVGLPFLVFKTLKFRKPFKVTPIDPREEDLPRDVRKFFAEAHRSMLENGFDYVGAYFLPPLIPNVRALIGLYVNRVRGDTAMSTLIVASGAQTIQTRYVEFVRRHSDDIVVQTNNTRELGSFPARPGERTTRFSRIHDVSELYRLHRFCCEKYRETGTPVIRLDTECDGDGRDFIERIVLEESFDDQVKTGYLRKDQFGFSPTIKGAALMGWRELPPIKQFRRWNRDMNAGRILAEARAQGVIA